MKYIKINYYFHISMHFFVVTKNFSLFQSFIFITEPLLLYAWE